MSLYQKYEDYSGLYSGPNQPDDELTANDKESFKNGYTKLVLHPKLILHRFCDSGKPLGAFWMDEDSFVPIIHEVQHVELPIPESHRRNTLRNTFALMMHWENYNRVTHRQKITLTKEWVAYVGEVGPQSVYAVATHSRYIDNQRDGAKVEKRIERRLGGGWQIVIPAMRKVNMKSGGNLGFDINVDRQHIFKATYSKAER
jgi:hypothetical protein